jgi:hypothetical protein
MKTKSLNGGGARLLKKMMIKMRTGSDNSIS